jgi:hypothetical protein
MVIIGLLDLFFLNIGHVDRVRVSSFGFNRLTNISFRV